MITKLTCASSAPSTCGWPYLVNPSLRASAYFLSSGAYSIKKGVGAGSWISGTYGRAKRGAEALGLPHSRIPFDDNNKRNSGASRKLITIQIKKAIFTVAYVEKNIQLSSRIRGKVNTAKRTR